MVQGKSGGEPTDDIVMGKRLIPPVVKPRPHGERILQRRVKGDHQLLRLMGGRRVVQHRERCTVRLDRGDMEVPEIALRPCSMFDDRCALSASACQGEKVGELTGEDIGLVVHVILAGEAERE